MNNIKMIDAGKFLTPPTLVNKSFLML